MSASDIFNSHSKLAFEKLIKFLLEVQELSLFYADGYKLRTHLRNMLDWNQLNIDINRKNLATAFMDHRDFREDIVFQALYVIVHASLEQFIRESIENIIRTINDSHIHFDDIKDSLKQENTYRTGLLLSSIKKPKDHYSIDFNAASKCIGSCHNGSQSFDLYPKAFSLNFGTISALSIEKLFERVGIKIDWDYFGRSINLKKLFKATKSRSCSKEVKHMLNEMVSNRNRIAHSGGDAADVSKLDFEMELSFVPIFAKNLSEFIARKLPL